jgi:hypothetical protein
MTTRTAHASVPVFIACPRNYTPTDDEVQTALSAAIADACKIGFWRQTGPPRFLHRDFDPGVVDGFGRIILPPGREDLLHFEFDAEADD